LTARQGAGTVGPAPGPVQEQAAGLSGERPAPLVDEVEAVPFDNPRSARHIARGLLANPASLLGTLIIIGLVLVAVLAPVLAPCPKDDPRQAAYCGRNPYHVPKYGFSKVPEPPSPEHPFGTTRDQYDIYYGVVWGTRTAFKVGLAITFASLLIGLCIGSVSAYKGGWIDEVMMRVVEVFQAFPFLLAAITLATVLRSQPRFQGVMPAVLALIAFSWTGYARLVRADVLSVKQREYVWAARSLGAGDLRIIAKHVLPNSIYPVLVVASLDIGTIVVTFAALSFFGIGVPDGYADWGQMVSSARDLIPHLTSYWYIVAFPGAAIVLFSLAWNLIGDAFRDLLDPRFTSKRGA
jgi:peptide/nickel transport system permease protein